MIRLKSRHAGDQGPAEPVKTAITEDETAEDATEVSEIDTGPDASDDEPPARGLRRIG